MGTSGVNSEDQATFSGPQDQSHLSEEVFVDLQQLFGVEKGMISNDYIGISGEPGSGKSFISTILGREFLKKDILCLTISLQSVKGSRKLSLVEFLVQHSTIDFYPT